MIQTNYSKCQTVPSVEVVKGKIIFIKMKKLKLELNKQLQELMRKKKFQISVFESEVGKRLNLKMVDFCCNFQEKIIPTDTSLSSILQTVEKTIRKYPVIHGCIAHLGNSDGEFSLLAKSFCEEETIEHLLSHNINNFFIEDMNMFQFDVGIVNINELTAYLKKIRFKEDFQMVLNANWNNLKSISMEGSAK